MAHGYALNGAILVIADVIGNIFNKFDSSTWKGRRYAELINPVRKAESNLHTSLELAHCSAHFCISESKLNSCERLSRKIHKTWYSCNVYLFKKLRNGKFVYYNLFVFDTRRLWTDWISSTQQRNNGKRNDSNKMFFMQWLEFSPIYMLPTNESTLIISKCCVQCLLVELSGRTHIRMKQQIVCQLLWAKNPFIAQQWKQPHFDMFSQLISHISFYTYSETVHE